MSTLFIVATPIGNLQDITLRALDVLSTVDVILAEDTRVTSKLLQAHGITTKKEPFHQHSKNIPGIVSRLVAGESMALVSDAGTPGVNDPGGMLIEAVLATGQEVDIVPIPGASALTAILSVAGIPLERFSYRGYVPHKKGKQTYLREVCESKDPVVFFESTHRIIKTLEALSEVNPEKNLIVGRELTKMHESIYRGRVDEVKEKIESDSTKGEFVLIAY